MNTTSKLDLAGQKIAASAHSVADKIAYWDDERSSGNSLIVTLKAGWQWDDGEGHTKGFDTVKEAVSEIRKYTKPCNCASCQKELSKTKS